MFIEMLAKLMRSGCALRPPVIAVILVLSEDKITPRRVAPGASLVYGSLVEIICKKEATNL